MKDSAWFQNYRTPDAQGVPEETVKNQNDNTSPRSRNPNKGVSATHGARRPCPGGALVMGGALPLPLTQGTGHAGSE